MSAGGYPGAMRSLSALLLALAAACGGPPSSTSATSAGGSSTTGEGESTSSGGCESSGGLICVAEYAADTLGGERSPGRCAPASECVGALDLGRWCFDHAGCCEGLRCRAVDGICEEPGLGQDTTGTTGAGGTETGTTGDGEATGDSDATGESDTTGGDATGDTTGDTTG